MKFKPSFFVIPLLAFLIVYVGRLLTKSATAWAWYRSINLPEVTPPDWVFPIVWNSIFLLSAIAALLVWNNFVRTFSFWLIITLFLTNAFLNIFWTFLFFRHHLIGFALLDAIVLEIVTIALVVFIAKKSVWVSLLLLPYVAWVAFAIYLNYLILMLN